MPRVDSFPGQPSSVEIALVGGGAVFCRDQDGVRLHRHRRVAAVLAGGGQELVRVLSGACRIHVHSGRPDGQVRAEAGRCGATCQVGRRDRVRVAGVPVQSAERGARGGGTDADRLVARLHGDRVAGDRQVGGRRREPRDRGVHDPQISGHDTGDRGWRRHLRFAVVQQEATRTAPSTAMITATAMRLTLVPRRCGGTTKLAIDMSPRRPKITDGRRVAGHTTHTPRSPHAVRRTGCTPTARQCPPRW